MGENEKLYRPNPDISRELTEASVNAIERRRRDHDEDRINKSGPDCDAVKNMPTFENAIHNTSPNATNIQD